MQQRLGPTNSSEPFTTSSEILRRSRNSYFRERETEKKALDCIAFCIRGRERRGSQKKKKEPNKRTKQKHRFLVLPRCLCSWVLLPFLSDGFCFPRRRLRNPLPSRVAKWAVSTRRKRWPEPFPIRRRRDLMFTRARGNGAMVIQGEARWWSHRRRRRRVPPPGDIPARWR